MFCKISSIQLRLVTIFVMSHTHTHTPIRNYDNCHHLSRNKTRAPAVRDKDTLWLTYNLSSNHHFNVSIDDGAKPKPTRHRVVINLLTVAYLYSKTFTHFIYFSLSCIPYLTETYMFIKSMGRRNSRIETEARKCARKLVPCYSNLPPPPLMDCKILRVVCLWFGRLSFMKLCRKYQ